MEVFRCRAGTASVFRRPLGARLAAFVLIMVSMLGFVSVAQIQPAWAVSGDAQQLLNLINQERAAVGSQPLAFRDDLVAIAADHSDWMASTGIFQHRSDLSEGVTGPWTRIGENIAYGWSVSNIHRMFMKSKGHCENNLYSGFNRVGIEFATGGNGAMYVTVVFVQESGGSLPKPTVCPYDYSATTTTAAPPVTTTTAAPPASTTTTARPAATTSTTTVGDEVVLSLASTTTTLPVSTTGAPARVNPADDSTRAIGEGPISATGEPTDAGNDRGSFPVLPLAGAVTAFAAVGVWWLVGAKRTALAGAKPPWEIPHTGVRPPE